MYPSLSVLMVLIVTALAALRFYFKAGPLPGDRRPVPPPLVVEGPAYTLALPARWRESAPRAPGERRFIIEDTSAQVSVTATPLDPWLADTEAAAYAPHGGPVDDPETPGAPYVEPFPGGHRITQLWPAGDGRPALGVRNLLRPHVVIALSVNAASEAAARRVLDEVEAGLTLAPAPAPPS